MLESPSLQLQEGCKAVQELSGVAVSPLCADFTRKKMCYVAVQEAHSLEQTSWPKSFSTGETNLYGLVKLGCDCKDGIRKYEYAIRGKTPGFLQGVKVSQQ